MEVQWKKVLKDSISEAFSTMYFMVPEEAPNLLDERSQDFSGKWFQSSLSAQKGDVSIEVWAWGPEELATLLTANILSCEPSEVEPEDVMDSYGELLNIIVGSVLTAIDPKGEWQMGLPHPSELKASELSQAFDLATEHLYFDLEEQPFVCGWHFTRN